MRTGLRFLSFIPLLTALCVGAQTPLPISQGGTGATTAAGAQANLGVISTTYNVLSSEFGCADDNVTDETACIQAAFTACHTTTSRGGSGVVQFPGNHIYLVSSTINTFQRCAIEGSPVSGYNGTDYRILPTIKWTALTSSVGAVSTFTSYTIAANTSYTSEAFPSGESTPYTVTFSGVATLPAANQWIEVSGLATPTGLGLDRAIMQVASVGTNSFIALLPYGLGPSIIGTLPYTVTESGTATTVSVVFAADGASGFGQAVTNLEIAPAVGTGTSSTLFNVGIYYGSSVDTGTNIANVEIEGATEYSYYFSSGGMNTKFDGGWRSDGAGIAAIYFRAHGLSSLAIYNGTVDNGRSSYSGGNSGGMILLDNGHCSSGSHFHFQDIKVEQNSNQATDSTYGLPLGVVTMYSCPSEDMLGYAPEFEIIANNIWTAPGPLSVNGTAFSVIPANDNALQLTIESSQFMGFFGSNYWPIFSGLPLLNAQQQINQIGGSTNGSRGYFPLLTYYPPTNSMKGVAFNYKQNASPVQFLGDMNIGQLWQLGVPASAFMYADTAYAALPNGTTLYAGQILAPPSYWYKANGNRYALDVVYKAGTTGTLNSGLTTCYTGYTNGTTQNILLCTTALGLSVGQVVSLGSNSYLEVVDIDATTFPVTVYVSNGWTTSYPSTSQPTLAYVAPLLAPEIQMLTKSSAVPTSGTWIVGDYVENSGAAANGIAGWVCITAGTPGTWAAVPLGSSTGQIASSQISNLAFQSLTTTGTSGAATLSGGVLNIPQYARGASTTITGTVASASGTITTAHTFSTNFTSTPVCTAAPYSNSGAWYFSTLPSVSSTGVITYTTSGIQTFAIQCTGPGGAW